MTFLQTAIWHFSAALLELVKRRRFRRLSGSHPAINLTRKRSRQIDIIEKRFFARGWGVGESRFAFLSRCKHRKASHSRAILPSVSWTRKINLIYFSLWSARNFFFVFSGLHVNTMRQLDMWSDAEIALERKKRFVQGKQGGKNRTVRSTNGNLFACGFLDESIKAWLLELINSPTSKHNWRVNSSLRFVLLHSRVAPPSSGTCEPHCRVSGNSF